MIPLLKELLALWGCFNRDSLSFALHQHDSLSKAPVVCERAGLNVRVTSSGRAGEHLTANPPGSTALVSAVNPSSAWTRATTCQGQRVRSEWVLLWHLPVLFSFLTATGWGWDLHLKAMHSWYPEMSSQETKSWSVGALGSQGQLWASSPLTDCSSDDPTDCLYHTNPLFSVIIKENNDFGWSGNRTKWVTILNHNWERIGPSNLAT